MVHPLSRAGILEAMTGGTYAAQAALRTIELADETARQPFYAVYKKKWDEAYGRSHRAIARIKKTFNHIPDKDFDRAAHALARLPRHKQTMFRIVFTTLWHSPMLLWRMRSLFFSK
jgi:flavin-dependent dehydrogenase